MYGLLCITVFLRIIYHKNIKTRTQLPKLTMLIYMIPYVIFLLVFYIYLIFQAKKNTFKARERGRESKCVKEKERRNREKEYKY